MTKNLSWWAMAWLGLSLGHGGVAAEIPSGRPTATHGPEISEVSPELQTGVLEGLGVHWDRPWAPTEELAKLDPGAPITVEDWSLLVRDAAGVLAGIPEGLVASFMESRGINGQAIARIAESRGASEAAVREAIRRHVAILQRAEEWGAEHVTISDAEISPFLRQVSERLKARVVLLKTEAVLDSVEQPTREELTAFFAERQTADCEEDLPYGTPPTVRVEYLVLSRDEIARGISPSESSLRAYWREYPERFPDASRFEDVRDVVLEAYRQSEAGQIGARVSADLARELRAPWDGAKVGEDGFAIAPAAVKREGYLEAVARRTAEAQGVPIRVKETGLITFEEASSVPGIGRATWPKTEKSKVLFRYVAFHVQGIRRKPPATSQDWALALYEPTGVLYERSEGRVERWYVGRVVEVVHAMPAEDVTWVWSEVERDWRRRKAFEMAHVRAEGLVSRGREVGLADALEEADGLRAEFGESVKLLSPAPFARRERTTDMEFELMRIASKRSVVNGFPLDTTFVKRCFALAEDLTRESGEDSGGRLVGALPFGREEGWAVLEVEEIQPVPDFPEAYRAAVGQRLRIEAFYRAVRGYFDPAEIRKRVAKLP